MLSRHDMYGREFYLEYAICYDRETYMKEYAIKYIIISKMDPKCYTTVSLKGYDRYSNFFIIWLFSLL